LEGFVDESTGQNAFVVSPTGENVRPLFHTNVTAQNVWQCLWSVVCGMPVGLYLLKSVKFLMFGVYIHESPWAYII
jgi:hypothetical protein